MLVYSYLSVTLLLGEKSLIGGCGRWNKTYYYILGQTTYLLWPSVSTPTKSGNNILSEGSDELNVEAYRKVQVNQLFPSFLSFFLPL